MIFLSIYNLHCYPSIIKKTKPERMSYKRRAYNTRVRSVAICEPIIGTVFQPSSLNSIFIPLKLALSSQNWMLRNKVLVRERREPWKKNRKREKERAGKLWETFFFLFSVLFHSLSGCIIRERSDVRRENLFTDGNWPWKIEFRKRKVSRGGKDAQKPFLLFGRDVLEKYGSL